MNNDVDFKERLMSIYSDCVEGNKIDNDDRDFVISFLLDQYISDDLKYEYYLDTIKGQALYILKLFNKWCENLKGNYEFVFKQYSDFYKSIEVEFTKDIYKCIYMFFHPIVIDQNFTVFENNKKVLISLDTIADMFATFMFYNTFDKEEFIKEKINLKKEAKPLDMYYLKRIIFFYGDRPAFLLKPDDLSNPKYLFYRKHY